MKTKRSNNFFGNGGPRTIVVATVIFLALVLVLQQLTEFTRQVELIPYSSFVERIDKGLIKQAHIAGQEVTGRFKDGSRFETVVPENNPKLWESLQANNVEITVEQQGNQFNWWYLFPFASLMIMLWGFWYFMRQTRNSNNGGGNIFTMGKSRARMFMPSSIKENFNSVAGADEAKEELSDIIDYLKNPSKYERLGAKMTRGVLLIGAPGNGKTLLARAVAGEANCPFFSVSGSDFIEVFVGVGAARVRDLFKRAREHAPAIVFIDEIDAIGGKRGNGFGGGHDEREQTLNQLLTEMDGFQTHDSSVVVIAATNRPDVLDEALLRPGRFDRRVAVPYPDLKSREYILRVHAARIKIEPTVDRHKIARGTPGFSGADLANLVNEAAIIASKANKDLVSVADFEEAKDKINMGREVKTYTLTEEDKKIIAYHEAGHALIPILNPSDTDPVHKISIIPRSGGALGATYFLPNRERYIHTKEEYLTLITRCCGGRAAESLVFNRATTGPCDDFIKASAAAREMVCLHGMSPKVGHAVYRQGQNQFQYSPDTARKIDEEVNSIIDTCYQEAYRVLQENRDKLDLLAGALLEKETMDAHEIYALFGLDASPDHRFS